MLGIPRLGGRLVECPHRRKGIDMNGLIDQAMGDCYDGNGGFDYIIYAEDSRGEQAFIALCDGSCYEAVADRFDAKVCDIGGPDEDEEAYYAQSEACHVRDVMPEWNDEAERWGWEDSPIRFAAVKGGRVVAFFADEEAADAAGEGVQVVSVLEG